jgi:hypothetical protein
VEYKCTMSLLFLLFIIVTWLLLMLHIYNSSFRMFRHIFTKLKELSPFLILDCRKHNRLFPFISNFILRSRVISLTGRHQVLYMDNARYFNYKGMFEFSDCDKLVFFSVTWIHFWHDQVSFEVYSIISNQLSYGSLI